MAAASSLHFVAPSATGLDLGTATPLTALSNPRAVSKADMINNSDLPSVTVDPDSFAVHVNGELIEPAPVEELPMAQRYFLV